MAERAVLLVDGNNWYHGLREIGVQNPAQLDYCKISQKLCGPRDWVQTRYYIGQMKTQWSAKLYSDQRSFLASLSASDPRITVHLGRLEPREARSDAADELLEYMGKLKTKIDPKVHQELFAIGRKHRTTSVLVEKAVDVMLAVDLVVLAHRNEYDTAYVLSADGDYTHAVQYVRGLGKKVFAASATSGAQLASVVNSFIRVPRGWFADCYKPSKS